MKKIIVMFLVFFAFSFPASAQGSDPSEIYREQFQNSGLADIYNELPQSAKDLLASMDIDPASGELPSLSPEGALKHIFAFMRDGIKTPAAVCGLILAVILLLSMLSPLAEKRKYSFASQFAGVLCLASSVLIPVYNCLMAVVSALKGTTAFMIALVPVYVATLTAGGYASTAAVSSGMLMSASQITANILSFGLAPIIGMHLALCISASVSPMGSLGKVADIIKKTAGWALSALLTLFLGVLSLQTCITSSADTLSLRAAKYLAGSIPVVGGAVGETVAVVKSALNLLGKTAAGYGMIAVAAIIIPLLLELVIWRGVLNIGAAAGCLLGVPKAEELLKGCDNAVAFLAGIALYIGLLFIISLGIISSAMGGGM